MSAPDGLNVNGTCNAQHSPARSAWSRQPQLGVLECSWPESHVAKPHANDAEGMRQEDAGSERARGEGRGALHFEWLELLVHSDHLWYAERADKDTAVGPVSSKETLT